MRLGNLEPLVKVLEEKSHLNLSKNTVLSGYVEEDLSFTTSMIITYDYNTATPKNS